MKKPGTVHPRTTKMFLRVHGGEAAVDDRKYEFSSNIVGGNPIILSHQTRKWFTLNWQEIIEMAIDAGIDTPEPKPTKGRNEHGNRTTHSAVARRTKNVPR